MGQAIAVDRLNLMAADRRKTAPREKNGVENIREYLHAAPAACLERQDVRQRHQSAHAWL